MVLNHVLIIGSNYNGTKWKLKGCVNDCNTIYQQMLKREMTEVTRLISFKPLIKEKVINSLKTFVSNLQPYSNGFLFFSGHGSQLNEKKKKTETDGKDEILFLNKDEYIRDDELSKIFKTAKKHVHICVVFDCCHSATMIDLPYSMKNLQAREESTNKFKADIVCISGCLDKGKSYERSGKGYLTECFVDILRTYKGPFLSESFPWVDFYLRVTSAVLSLSGSSQVAQLSFTTQSALKDFFIK